MAGGGWRRRLRQEAVRADARRSEPVRARHTQEEIVQLLNQWRAMDTIKGAGAKAVIITNGGIIVPGTRQGNTTSS